MAAAHITIACYIYVHSYSYAASYVFFVPSYIISTSSRAHYSIAIVAAFDTVMCCTGVFLTDRRV